MNGGGGSICRKEQRRHSRLKNGEVIAQEGKDVKIFQDQISKLREHNRHLVQEINSSREEKDSLSKTSMENERLFLQCRAELNEMESELIEFMARTKELDDKTKAARHLWEAEKRNLEGTLAEMQTNLEMAIKESGLLKQKNGNLSTEMESLKAQLNECNAKLASMENERDQNERCLHQCRTEKIDLEYELNESKGRSVELLKKFEEGYLLCQAEKSNLQCTVEELQTKLDLMDSETVLLSKNNTELGIEATSLKAQLNECNTRLASMENEMDQNERSLHQCRTEKSDLESELNESKGKCEELLRKFEEDCLLWQAEKSNLQTKLYLMHSERGLMSKNNTELGIEAASLKVQLNESKARLASMENEREQNERSLHQCRTEKIDLESELNESKGKSQELQRKNEEACLLWQAEKSNLQCTVEELLTKLDLMDSERGLLSKNNTELGTEAESLKAQLNECNAKLACMQNERDHTETALHQYRTEKIDLESELNESKGRSRELHRKFEEGCLLWQAEKSNLQCTVEELLTKLDLMDTERGLLSKNNIELGTEAESLKVQLNELESEFNQYKACSQELLGKLDENWHLWDTEKKNLKDIIAKLQTELELMASESASLSQRNNELNSELDSSKAQLMECNVAFVCMVDERQMLKSVSSSNAKRLEALMSENATKEKKINCLQQQVNEATKLQSDLTQQYELSENSLKQQNEKLQEELAIVKCLLEAQKRIGESNVENGRSNKHAKELSKTVCGDLWNWSKFMLKLVIVRPFRTAKWMILLPFAFVSLVLEICIFLITKFSNLFFKWVT